MPEITEQNAWDLVRNSVVAGERLRTWSVAHGEGNTSFVIEEILPDRLKVRLDSTGGIRTLSHRTFSRLGEVWSRYLDGDIARHELRERSHHTSYALPLLRRAASL